MPKVNIDGQTIEFEGQHRLLQFCLDRNVEIPYFCYHPAMSTPTNCRMCLVEIGNQDRNRETGEWVVDEQGNPVVRWFPKPMTACNQSMADGLFVKTHRTSEKIRIAQKGVLEYMLINHPLDCPICDQAGECPLQIWTFKYGPEGSRFEVTKGHKNKRVELGPRVMLDEERCINCTRCVRFTEEVSKTQQLSIVGRGEKNCPSAAPGATFDDPYSMNTIDICPVGALTSRAHRFKARVWEMAYTPSIDLNDSTGTNTYVWIRDNEVMRITPRHNAAVNQYWMPDAHRLNTALYNENRVSGTYIKGRVSVPFEDGLRRAASLLKGNDGEIVMLGSAYASLESNFALKQLAAHLGVTTVHYVPHVVPGAGDNWLIQDDRTPNAAACELLGFEAIQLEDLIAMMAGGKIGLLYSLENDRTFAALTPEMVGDTCIITHALQFQPGHTLAEVVLPAAIAIEAEGTYVNYKGIAQVSQLARQFRQMTPEQWMQVPKSRLDKSAVAVDRWRNLDHILDVLPGWLMISRIARQMGLDMPYETHADIFGVIQPAFEALKDLKVSYKAPKHAFKASQLEFAPKW
ncbi:MAG: 2Fe-2S iron-sulfur cluster-binding protein [Bacteroidia bacterium]|nr:2Fe-2S iron-sulfur cluster-binding protein [Bacteroidia bacterium]